MLVHCLLKFISPPCPAQHWLLLPMEWSHTMLILVRPPIASTGAVNRSCQADNSWTLNAPRSWQDVNVSLTTVHMHSCFYTSCANCKWKKGSHDMHVIHKWVVHSRQPLPLSVYYGWSGIMLTAFHVRWCLHWLNLTQHVVATVWSVLSVAPPLVPYSTHHAQRLTPSSRACCDVDVGSL